MEAGGGRDVCTGATSRTRDWTARSRSRSFLGFLQENRLNARLRLPSEIGRFSPRLSRCEFATMLACNDAALAAEPLRTALVGEGHDSASSVIRLRTAAAAE
jgi:hypothetical protein